MNDMFSHEGEDQPPFQPRGGDVSDEDDVLANLDEPTRTRIQNAGRQGMIDEVRRIKAEKDAAQQAGLLEAYVKEMTDPANRGKPHLLHAIKEKFRNRGLNVDHIGFH